MADVIDVMFVWKMAALQNTIRKSMLIDLFSCSSNSPQRQSQRLYIIAIFAIFAVDFRHPVFVYMKRNKQSSVAVLFEYDIHIFFSFFFADSGRYFVVRIRMAKILFV